MKRFVAYALLVAIASQSLPSLADSKDKPPPSEAQKAEARARYERGLKLYDQGAYEPALVEMRRAYELNPTYKILYNLGLIHKQLNDHAAALDAFNGYLNEGGKKIDGKRHAEVEKYVAELKPLVATLTIQVDVAGAEVTIDDALIGTSPLPSSVTVNAGKRKISAKVAGKPAVTRVLTVAGSDAVTVKLELEEPKATTTTPTNTTSTTTTTTTTTTTKPTTPEPKSNIPWVWWGVTGGLAAGTAVFGILTLSSASSLAEKRDTPNASRDDLDSASSRTKTFAIVTDVLLVGTIVAGGYATYLTLTAPKKESVNVGVAPNGLVVFGSF
jgi:hypothetical protein